MKIGILQTGRAPDAMIGETGDYPEMFERLLSGRGFTFETYPVLDGVFPASVTECDGWLITGSRHGAYEDHPWNPPLEQFIRDAHDAHVPMVGICFGHQIIAQAMGGKVERFDKGWAVGPTDYELEGGKVRLNAWHRDQVTELPPGAQVIGSNDFCANAALLFDDWAYTVQAHPEYDPGFIAGLMQHRGKGVVPEPLMKAAKARLSLPLDNSGIADKIADVFNKARAKVPG